MDGKVLKIMSVYAIIYILNKFHKRRDNVFTHGKS